MLGSRENSVNGIDDTGGSIKTIKEEEGEFNDGTIQEDEEEEENENFCNSIHNKSESDDSWDEESDIEEILEEDKEEFHEFKRNERTGR